MLADGYLKPDFAFLEALVEEAKVMAAVSLRGERLGESHVLNILREDSHHSLLEIKLKTALSLHIDLNKRMPR